MSSDAWDEFMASIHEAEKEVSAHGKGAWYRGHRDGQWKLTPTLLRSPKGVLREETLFAEVRFRGAKFISAAKSDWEVAALMQHLGVPTRLLDWTESLFVAIYFATSGETENPCIWVANPFLINAKATGQKVIYDFSDDKEMEYGNLFSSASSWPHERPVSILSPWTHRRIESQQGFFTVHGNSTDDLDIQLPRFVKKVTIPSNAIEHAEGLLSRMGIDAHSIFQDFDSLGVVLKNKHDLN